MRKWNGRVKEEVEMSVVGDEMAHVESGKGERKPGSLGLQVQRVDKFKSGARERNLREMLLLSLLYQCTVISKFHGELH